MLLKEKGEKDAEPVSMGWDEAQAALAAGTHEVVEDQAKDAKSEHPAKTGDKK